MKSKTLIQILVISFMALVVAGTVFLVPMREERVIKTFPNDMSKWETELVFSLKPIWTLGVHDNRGEPQPESLKYISLAEIVTTTSVETGILLAEWILLCSGFFSLAFLLLWKRHDSR